MVLAILQMVLPVILTFLLGAFCRRRQIVKPEGLAGVRALVSSILLPVVLFNAFFTEYAVVEKVSKAQGNKAAYCNNQYSG